MIIYLVSVLISLMGSPENSNQLNTSTTTTASSSNVGNTIVDDLNGLIR